MSMPTILVADDCQSVRLSIKRILEAAGYTVIVATNGEEALELLSKDPALVILDVNMPCLDGFGFCEKLAENPRHSDMPVVFCTTEKSMALELLGNTMGAYLQKPVDRESLLGVIQEQLLSKAGK